MRGETSIGKSTLFNAGVEKSATTAKEPRKSSEHCKDVESNRLPH